MNNDYDSGTVITLANIGDKVYFRGNNERWNYTYEIGIGTEVEFKFMFNFTGTISASGDLIYLASKKGTTKTALNFGYLFSQQTGLVQAPRLGFTTLSKSCYKALFAGCSNLTEAPELPAKQMQEWCYYIMFSGCTSLQFPPALPSVSLAKACYDSMFNNCTSLKVAPELPATTLVSMCYSEMFKKCTLIDRLRVGFSDWAITGNTGGDYKTQNWLNQGSVTGTLECPSALDTSIRDDTHIPAGWSVVRTTAVNGDWNESDSNKTSYILNKNISTEVDVSDSTYEISVGSNVPVITVASSLTLSAGTVASGKVGYAEVVIDLANNATVTAGSGLTMVDTLTAGKRNVCVARWQNGACKLYVTIVEDIPQA